MYLVSWVAFNLLVSVLSMKNFDLDVCNNLHYQQPEVLHGGRPKHEEPHVKKIKKRTYEKIEYILRVDLESLGINEDDFDDLQSLFEVMVMTGWLVEWPAVYFSCTTETGTEL